MIDRIRTDLRSAWRAFRAAPATIIAAAATIAVAVGVNLAIWGLVDRALVSPAAGVTDPQHLFTVTFAPNDAPAQEMAVTSFAQFKAVRDAGANAQAAAFQRVNATVSTDDDTREVRAVLMSPTYFEVVGVRPVVGVVGLSEEATAPVAWLSDSYWHTAFRASREVLHRHLRISGQDYIVGGVLPPGFAGHTSEDVDVFLPIAVAMQSRPGWDTSPYMRSVSVIVRTEHDASTAAAFSEAATMHVALHPVAGADVGATERRVAWWLAGVSVLVLVIGMANAATLLLLAGVRRQRDRRIQLALGATAGRLVSQVIAEALLMACVAALLAVPLASVFDDVIRRQLFATVIAHVPTVSGTVRAALAAGLVAAVIAAATGALFVLGDLRRRHASASIAATASHTRQPRALTALLFAQTAMSVLLVAGAGFFGRSLQALTSQDFGMQMDGVIVADFPPEEGDHGAWFREAVDRVRALPGVEQASLFDNLPLKGFNVPPIAVPGRPMPEVDGQLPYLEATTPAMLQMLGVRLIDGRLLTAADASGPMVVLVNESMARGVWPGQRAVGQCIRIGFDPDFDPMTAVGPPTPSEKVPCREVVGVVHDVRQRSVIPTGNEARLMQYFVPMSQTPRPPFAPDDSHVGGILLRARVSATTLAPEIRRLVGSGRPDMPFLRVAPYASVLDRPLHPWTLGVTLMSLFGGLASLVASVGLYAAFAHAVARRRKEIAIRMAIGAAPAMVRALVLRDAFVLTGAGCVAGIIGAVAAARTMTSLLFGTTPLDPVVLAGACGLMLLIAAGATFVPARAAARTDPHRLLRTD